MTKTMKIIFWAIGGVLAIGLMIAGTIADFDISKSMIDKSNEFGSFMDMIGDITPGLFLAFGCSIALNSFLATPKELDNGRIAKTIITFIIYILSILWIALKTFEISNLRREFIYVGIGVLVLSIIMTIIISMIDKQKLIKARNIGITIILSAIAILAVVTVIKLFWGRVRPEDLNGVASEFTPWYIPRGFNKNTSFPSGHVSNATTVFALMLFVPLVKNKIGKIALIALPISWVGLMAYARIVNGKHFLTDVTMAFVIGTLIFLLMSYIVKKYCYQISLTEQVNGNVEIEKSVEVIPNKNTVISEEVKVTNNDDVKTTEKTVEINETDNQLDDDKINDLLNSIMNEENK